MELQKGFFVGVVEDNKDPNRSGRIKVRVQNLYNDLEVEDIPYASPFAGLAGKDFQVPAVGKLVNVLFLSDNIYAPYYVYSEKYNINLKNKLEDLDEEEYTNFIALLVDERTNIFVDSKELTIDHLYNKITINNDSINLELKDNTQILNLGSKGADQDAVLGTRYFEWMDEFIQELLSPFSLIGNTGAPVIKTKLQLLCQKYLRLRPDFVSNNVKVVDNREVQKLERNPETIFHKNDEDLILDIDPDTECTKQKRLEISGQSEQSEQSKQSKQKDIKKKIDEEKKKACKQGKASQPSSFTKSDSEMLLPLEGRLSSDFGLRQDPTNPSKTKGHNGVDIASPVGTPVISPEDGVVIGKGFDSVYGGGNFIRIKHTNNIITGYAHLSKFLVTLGQKVKKGDEIALVGNTGSHTTGPHLHFTVTTSSNVKVDPKLYFSFNDTPANDDTVYQGQKYLAQSSSDCEEETLASNTNKDTAKDTNSKKVDSENDPNVEGSPLSSQFDNEMFIKATEDIINNFEGGYFHPNMLADGRLNDKRYQGSGETMFGIDRKTGGPINSSAAGKKFWSIIDNSKASDNWKWNYFGGNKKSELIPLVAEMMKPRFDKFAENYLSQDALQIVNSDPKLLLHFEYATWNGSKWFKIFAEPINKAVQRGVTDINTLREIAINSRVNSSNSLIAQAGEKVKNIFNA